MLHALSAFKDSYIENQYCQEEYAKAKLAEPAITNDLVSISKGLGNKMIDLNCAIKEASHVVEKIEKQMKKHPNLTMKEVTDSLNDVVRYTELCPHEKIAETTEKTISALREKGYQIYSIDNKFIHPNPDSHYKGMHIGVISPSGQLVELQIHSKESHDAKNLGHELYKLTSLNKISDKEQEIARQQMFDIFNKVSNPPGIEKIESFDLTETMTISQLKNSIELSQHCVLTSCSSTPDMIEIEGYIEDNSGNVVSSYSETTDHTKHDTVAVFCDNNGVDMYVSDPERLDRMIEDAVSSCDLPLLGELEECRCFLEGKEPDISLELSEQKIELDL